MWRLGLGMILGGGFLAFYGVNEWRLAGGAGAAPEPIAAAELEKGVPDNPYRTLGKHLPLYASVVYMGKGKKGSAPTDVDYAYYGVVAPDSPGVTEFLAKIAALEVEFGDKEPPPDRLPPLPPVRIVVKSHIYKTVASLKAAVDKSAFPTENLTGMVINRVSGLNADEVRLLRQGYRDFDPDKTVIFEAGRKPTDTLTALLMIAGGAVIALIPVAIYFAGRGGSSAGQTAAA